MDPVHVGRDEKQAQSFVQPVGQPQIAMVEHGAEIEDQREQLRKSQLAARRRWKGSAR